MECLKKYNVRSRKVKFEGRGNQFFKDDKETKIISGAVHYFRNMPDTWSDIFKKLRALGCNCAETYCAWNMHEKKQGEYCFDGILNISEFIKKATAEGLMVIVRPGPYIWSSADCRGGFKMMKIWRYAVQIPHI